MLYKDPFIIDPKTYRLIQDIQALPELKNFYLVGGTALALQYGHRNSIDIDLFTEKEFVADDIISVLQNYFDVEVSFKRDQGTLLTFVNNIKTDFIRHNYPLIKESQSEDGIVFLSTEDIAAMKLNAIVNSGKRLKDFVDIYFLLEHFSLNEMVSFFHIKYPHLNPLIVLKSLSYFDDIDPDMDPPKMKVKLPITKILKRINQAVLQSNKIFDK
jgi:hypothetical protein